MKKHFLVTAVAIVFFAAGILTTFAFKGNHQLQQGYILEHEDEIASQQPGPHNGGGSTTAFSFFSKATNCNLVFRKRVLHPGSSIGYHLQKENEIYYIVSGTGIMKMNGKEFEVKTGDAILTLPGSSHGLTPTGREDLVMFINYERK